MALTEQKAYSSGFSDEAFMEEAGKGVAEAAHAFILASPKIAKEVLLLCGKGNNAGDAYVAGCYLLEKGYDVAALQIIPTEECSPLCQKNHGRFLAKGGKLTNKIPARGVILDGVFGTGFKGSVKEPYASAIRAAKESKLPILAIDIPSGLEGDTGSADEGGIFAKETYFLGLPKSGFFLQEGWDRVGKLKRVDFGLPQEFKEKAKADFFMIDDEMAAPLLPRIVNSRHKYQAGYVVALAGSPGMPGAALLASTASLKAGAGIIKLLHPKGMEAELNNSPYEIIKIGYGPGNEKEVLELMNAASATLVGPGIGRSPATKKLLQKILPALEKPCVVDADALNLIAEDKITLPKQIILTPHVGEMIRLLKHSAPHPHTTEFIQTCHRFAEDRNLTLVLKGGPTFIFHPGTKPYVNPRGDPGMATAGSGDVLTGILAALLAQKLPPKNAALLGVFLHAIAGEISAEKLTSYSLMASDLICNLPGAFKSLGA